MTRVPLVRDSATFSAACRHTLHLRNSASPSRHSFVALSRNRGVDATVKFATACPVGVYRSSGSPHRFPMIVIVVSPAAIAGFSSLTAGPARCGADGDDMLGVVEV